MLRGRLIDIMAGSVFLFVGLTACAIAVVRGHRQARIFVWLGIWSALYGGQLLSQSSAALATMPGWMQALRPPHTAMIYLLVVFGLLSFSS
jgi:hypothetical protein